MNKIGSLYQVKKWYWLVFPNKETVTAVALVRRCGGGLHAHGVVNGLGNVGADYWSNYYNCNVTWFSPNDLVVLLETDGKYKKVLTTNGDIGWTWFEDSYNDCFEEVTQP